MLPPQIADEEQLYRMVGCIPGIPTWKDSENRPTSAAFKDKDGLSVDRDGGRTDDQVCRDMENRFENRIAVVSLLAGQCRQFGAYPVAKHEDWNHFHAEIHDSPTQIAISSAKARLMARNCRPVRRY